MIAALLICVFSPLAKANDDLAAALRASREYQFGDSRQALIVIERHALAADQEQAATLEAALIDLLAGEATTDCKRFICRQLAVVGTDASVDVLIDALADPDLCAHAALALLHHPSPRVDSELLLALRPLTGECRVQVIHLLGERRVVEAIVPLRIVAEAEANKEASYAAMRALASIASPDSAMALLSLGQHAASDASGRNQWMESLARCGRELAAIADYRDEALRIAAVLKDEEVPKHLQMAGLRIAVQADPIQAPRRIVACLQHHEQAWVDHGLSLVRSAPGATLAASLARMINQVQGERRPLFIEALGERGDHAAVAELSRQLVDADTAVVLAAARALSKLESVEALPNLLRLVRSEDAAIGESASDAIRSMRGTEVNRALARSLAASRTSEERAFLITALADRRAAMEAGTILESLNRDSSPAVRSAGLRALALLADSDDAEGILQLLLALPEPADRSAAADALLAALSRDRAQPADARTRVVIDALPNAPDEAVHDLLMVLAKIGGDAALATVRTCLTEESSRPSAIAALAQWADAAPAEDLAAIMEDEDDPDRAVAWQGYLRAARMAAGRAAPEALAMFTRAHHAASSESEAAAFLSALSQLRHPSALDLALAMLDLAAQIGRRAAESTITIARNLDDQHRLFAVDAIEKVRVQRSETQIQQAANEALDHIERHDDHILAWRLAGPYRRDQTGGSEVLDVEFLPEQNPDDPAVLWRDLYAAANGMPGRFDLTWLPNPTNCCAYARTSIWSDQAQEARLEIGTDDGVRVWLNGELVHNNNVMRGLTLRQDRVTISLQRGWNDLMLKISQGGGGWEFAVRMRDPSGRPLRGIRVDPHRQPTTPPDDAIVLFDGTSVDRWQHRNGADARWRVEDSALIIQPGTGSIQTREVFGDFSLHLEFMSPEGVPPSIIGQARSNSGVYLHGSYEVQILDSWAQPPTVDGCAAIYGVRPPIVNASRRPGEWQSYDIDFIAPRWNEQGEKVSHARISVRHNGVLVHDNVELPTQTGAGQPVRPGPGPIYLQDHGNPVQFRNIWIVTHDHAATAHARSEHGWQDLFNGQDLVGWSVRGGAAAFYVDDGAIVGETRANQPNSFLCTDEHFDDFELIMEFKVDSELNSGVQIRSHALAHSQNGRVHGYQVEIDPSDRAWTAGIYDEARRGWLFNLESYPAARSAFRQGEWNQMRINARGPVIRTYLNDVPAAMLIEGMTRSGFIGLQVHGVGGRADPLQIRWRSIRLRTIE